MDSSSLFAKHPEDYTLFELSEFDDEKGKFVPHDTPISLGVLQEYVV